MTDEMSNDYNKYLITRLSAGVFGEAYLLTAATEHLDKLYNLEAFVLSEKISGGYYHEELNLDLRKLPNEFGPVTIDLAMEEAKLHGKRVVQGLLEMRATETRRPELEFKEFCLNENQGSLYSFKSRNVLLPQIQKIVEDTNSERLRGYAAAMLGKSLK